MLTQNWLRSRSVEAIRYRTGKQVSSQTFSAGAVDRFKRQVCSSSQISLFGPFSWRALPP
jgi:hypothetical protein